MFRKTLSFSDCQIKTDGETGKFSGYASVFNSIDNGGDTILPGAYKKTLETNGLPKMFLQHKSSDLPIGKWLKAQEDDHGLWVEGELTLGMSRANDTYAALKHGTLDGLSIGYGLSKNDYEYVTGSDASRRIIKNITLLAEVSPVVFPMETQARIDLNSVKSGIDSIETVRDFERFLRDAGRLSKGLTEALVSRAKFVFSQGDLDKKTETEKAAQEVINRILFNNRGK